MNLLKKYKKLKFRQKNELLDLLLDDLIERHKFNQNMKKLSKLPNLFDDKATVRSKSYTFDKEGLNIEKEKNCQ